MTNSMQELWGSSHLSAGHAAYLETLYEKYLNNPEDLSSEWIDFFKNLPNASNGNIEISHQSIVEEFKNLSRASITSHESVDERQGKVIRLIQAYRNRGHQEATLDPLGIMQRDQIEDLKIEFHGLNESDLDDEFFMEEVDHLFPLEYEALDEDEILMKTRVFDRDSSSIPNNSVYIFALDR